VRGNYVVGTSAPAERVPGGRLKQPARCANLVGACASLPVLVENVAYDADRKSRALDPLRHHTRTDGPPVAALAVVAAMQTSRDFFDAGLIIQSRPEPAR
jgi:hypothetical protein